MNAADIAASLGAAQRSGKWWRCLCPVHGSRTGTSATLALRDGPAGLIVICHAGCTRDAVFDELRRRHLLDGRGDRHPAPPPTTDAEDRARRIASARRTWGDSRSAWHTPVADYLRGRGITVAPPPCLRYSPRRWHQPTQTEMPAMIARVDGPDGELIGVHRTYLRRDESGQWRRFDKRALGPIAGGAVRLSPVAETLIVAEGIETCLAAMLMTGRPGWAALSTSGLKSLILPSEVRSVIVVADNDSNGAGQRAARAAGLRWVAEGRRVRIVLPDKPDTDAADILASCATEAAAAHSLKEYCHA